MSDLPPNCPASQGIAAGLRRASVGSGQGAGRTRSVLYPGPVQSTLVVDTAEMAGGRCSASGVLSLQFLAMLLTVCTCQYPPVRVSKPRLVSVSAMYRRLFPCDLCRRTSFTTLCSSGPAMRP
jgi:hypothetical protein